MAVFRHILEVLFSVFVSSTSISTKTFFMKENVNHQELVPLEDYIVNIQTKTELRCVNRCFMSDGCMSIFYHSQTHQCVLHKFLGVYQELYQTNKTISNGWTHFEACLVTNEELVTDCTVLKNSSCSGVYYISPDQTRRVPVHCDMTTDGGGWTVLQRHSGYSIDFQRNWTEYERGFGDPYGDYWLDINNNLKYAIYKTFKIGDDSSEYMLTIGDYSGTAGDRMTYSNGMKFTTQDNDNDFYSENCVDFYKSGPWWHNSCCHSALNKVYRLKPYWYGLSVLKSVMMIRRL